MNQERLRDTSSAAISENRPAGADPEKGDPPAAYRDALDLPYYEEDFPGGGDAAYRAERCRLDVHYPVGAKNAATVLFFHGGGLVKGKKYFPLPLRESGLIVVSADYRLSSERARCPDYLHDAAAAAAWTFRHIAFYGGNPDLVFVCGCSGGAYLAAMIGMDSRYLGRHGVENRRFAGIMPVSGMMTTHVTVLNERIGATGLKHPGRAVIDEYAPLYHAAADLPPITLFAGDSRIEWPTRAEENALLASTLTRVAGHPDVTLHLLSGFDHGDISAPSFLLMRKRINRDRLHFLETRPES